MDTLVGGSLSVIDIRLCSLHKPLPLKIGTSTHLCNLGHHSEAQSAAVGSSGQIIIIILAQESNVILNLVTQITHDGIDFSGGQQIVKHKRVRLLCDLVIIRSQALSLQNSINSLDTLVLLAVQTPIQFLQFHVSLELLENTVFDVDTQFGSDVLHSVQDLICQPNCRNDPLLCLWAQCVQQFLCSLEHPNDHYVGVSVVLNTMSARFAHLMEFVRAHHS
mmetsp:Transcript_64153/g.106043  ORF Transcript_64153/g.106043 Transcript_64153/m.106043 type:complete len:220 (+) Transcript_64153:1850-2509(+)